MREGTGHLEQIGRGWFLRIRVKVPHARGKARTQQKRVRVGDAAELRSVASARAAADVWLRSQRPQSLQPGPGIRASEYFEHYLATHAALMRRSSQRRYRSAVRAHILPRFGRLRLEEIDARAVQAWIAEVAPKLARESIRGLRAILLQVLRQALSDGFSAHRIDPRGVRIPKETRPPRERREFGDADLARILEASPPQWRLLWAIMGYSGLRIGEALGLEWRHVDRAARVIRVSQNAVLGVLQPTKTETSKADIPIQPELAAYFDATLPGAPTALVFANGQGKPFRTDNVRARVLTPLLARIGIRHAGLHAFRHGLPGRLLALGASPNVVQRFMRHGSLRQTETYLHTANLDLHAALDRARNGRVLASS